MDQWIVRFLDIASSATAASWLQAVGSVLALGVAIAIPVFDRAAVRRRHRAAAFSVARHALSVIRDTLAISGDLSIRANWIGPLPTDAFRFADEAMGQMNLRELGDEDTVRCFLQMRAALDRVSTLTPIIDEISLRIIYDREQPGDRYDHVLLWNLILGHYHRGLELLLELAPLLLEPGRVDRMRIEVLQRFPIIEEASLPEIPLDAMPGYANVADRQPAPFLALSRRRRRPETGSTEKGLGEMELAPRYVQAQPASA